MTVDPRDKYKAMLSRAPSSSGRLAFINESSRLLDLAGPLSKTSTLSRNGNDDNKDEPPAQSATVGRRRSRVAEHLLRRWLPSTIEQDDRCVLNWDQFSLHQSTCSEDSKRGATIRTTRRRVFLFLTEPSTSTGSAIFFTILILAIALSNIVMILQTMKPWQFIPTDCVSCGGATSYLFEDDTPVPPYVGVDCVCPPAPLFSTIVFNDCCVYFFTVEWVLRVLSFAPAEHNRAKTYRGLIRQWYRFLTEATTVLDALAIFPYYLERFNSSKGLLSLRLLRLFRVFQLVRLGQYNTTFNVFTNVLAKSMIHLKLLLIVLVFGAAFFGSMVYWLEKGEWAYWDETGQFEFVRMSSNGATPEISPFFSIPQAFWWFLVTATTVGYGDISPTTTGGKLVAIAAMLTGVLVIAFPVSVFSDLWHKELAHHGALYTELLGEEAENDDDEELVIPRVAMDPKDVKQLAKEFQAMNCAHERIRGIFEKYDIPVD